MEQVLVLHCETYYREVDLEGLSHDGSEALHGAIWHEQEFFAFNNGSYLLRSKESFALFFFFYSFFL
jgi:hypothetical protein